MPWAAPGRLAQPSASLVGRTLVVAALALLATFFVRLYQVRTRFRAAMAKHNITILPHSFLFGHLKCVGKALAPYPRDFAKLAMPHALVQMYPEACAGGFLYLDTWPFGNIMCAVFHPDIAVQFTQDRSFPKADSTRHELGPLTGGRDLVTMDGQEWKTWRSVFNPGFSAKNLTALLPAFLEEIQVLKERLVRAARSGEVVNVEKTVQMATVDVICRAALGIRLHSQTRRSSFVETLQNQLWWLVCDPSVSNRLKENFPLRSFILWNNTRKMRNFLAPLIEEGINRYDSGKVSGPKTINDLAVKAYRAEVQQQQQQQQRIDPKFLETAEAQLKIFIFAGHDTTASTLSFAYSRLFRDPAALARIRAEFDEVLGPDASQTLARLTEDPSLLNQMPYAAAVVKETLRMYPPAGTARIAPPGAVLTHPETGQVLPTDGFLLWSCSWMSHRHPKFWERPDDFVPERWLAREGEPLYPRKNAWRPFELGPRNCIGQELALLELRAILAMTLRDLDFEPAYAADAPEVLGEKAYQVMGVGDITGHIKDGFPVRVRMRSRNAG